jgi:hypothetical protein
VRKDALATAYMHSIFTPIAEMCKNNWIGDGPDTSNGFKRLLVPEDLYAPAYIWSGKYGTLY